MAKPQQTTGSEVVPLRRTLARLIAEGESMRVLVTGATGHVGRIVVEQLVAAGARVRAMTRRPHEATFPEAVETVAGDLRSSSPRPSTGRPNNNGLRIRTFDRPL